MISPGIIGFCVVFAGSGYWPLLGAAVLVLELLFTSVPSSKDWKKSRRNAFWKLAAGFFMVVGASVLLSFVNEVALHAALQAVAISLVGITCLALRARYTYRAVS